MGARQSLCVCSKAEPPPPPPPPLSDEAVAEQWPRTIAQLTGPWLQSVLHGEEGAGVVLAHTAELVGQGVVADAFRVTVTWAGGAPPTPYIVKLSKEDPAARQIWKPYYLKEVAFFQQLRSRVPIACARCVAAFVDAAAATHCLVLEDCEHTEDEVTSFPLWMLGADEDLITRAVCDLARLHGSLLNSAELEQPYMAVEHSRDFLARLPFVPATVETVCMHFDPVSEETVRACPEAAGLPCSQALRTMLRTQKEKFGFKYTSTDGGEHYVGEGPMEFPAPTMHGERGKALLREVCRILGSRRAQTLIHGDGHPGSVFFRPADQSFTWIGFQLYHKGPPGWGESLALQCLALSVQ